MIALPYNSIIASQPLVTEGTSVVTWGWESGRWARGRNHNRARGNFGDMETFITLMVLVSHM